MIRADAAELDAQLRAAVEAGVERSSLRAVARQVGLSPTGLGKFLAGSRPYPSTRRKLERWAASLGAAVGGGLGGGRAMHVLRVLLQDLPPAAQAAAEERMLAALEAVYAAGAGGAPEWLRSLRGPQA
ncbi:MAG TPA: hypothetical protein VFH27_17555 [Longimicrobiaceae bacterium]|nr:hypothetical protein [Longimicrobiaceae bacterium]